MRESQQTHYTRHWANVTACKKNVSQVIYTSHFSKMVTCPACKAAMRSDKPVADRR